MNKNNAPVSVLTSTELNYIIYRYLQECGFHHSAFTFAHEAQVHRDTEQLDPNLVPPGALVTYIQKGMQYMEAEANMHECEVDPVFALLDPRDLLTKDLDELRALALEKKEKQTDIHAATAAAQAERVVRRKRERAAAQQQEKQQQEKQQQEKQQQEKQQQEKQQQEKQQQEKQPVQPPPPPQQQQQPPQQQQQQQEKQQQASEQQPNANASAPAAAPAATAALPPPPPPPAAAAAAADEAVPMEEDAPAAAAAAAPSGGVEVSNMELLHGHENEVFICAWSPTSLLLASGSGDATARIWDLSPGVHHGAALVLQHQAADGEKPKDVTTLDWHPDGSLLASGSYDGNARIWTKEGVLKQRLEQHKGPIFALKWSKKGDMLLSGSVDTSAIVWDARTGRVKQKFDFHTAPTLDVDWRNNVMFASCSTDKQIHVCKLGEDKPYKTFSGHADEVNCVRWDPQANLLASCSDDTTAKVWSMNRQDAVHTFEGHKRDIYTIKWSPCGPGSANPNQKLLLATASFDTTVKLWDVEAGKLLHSLEAHTEPVYSVCFSPDGKLMASGSFDKLLHIWNVADGRLVCTQEADGGIFEVTWSRTGDKVAASTSGKSIMVLDLKRL